MEKFLWLFSTSHVRMCGALVYVNDWYMHIGLSSWILCVWNGTDRMHQRAFIDHQPNWRDSNQSWTLAQTIHRFHRIWFECKRVEYTFLLGKTIRLRNFFIRIKLYHLDRSETFRTFSKIWLQPYLYGVRLPFVGHYWRFKLL